MITTANRATFERWHWLDGKRAREGDRGAAQPDHGDSEGWKRHHGGHGDPAGNIFQNVDGILDDPARDLRPA